MLVKEIMLELLNKAFLAKIIIKVFLCCSKPVVLVSIFWNLHVHGGRKLRAYAHVPTHARTWDNHCNHR